MYSRLSLLINTLIYYRFSPFYCFVTWRTIINNQIIYVIIRFNKHIDKVFFITFHIHIELFFKTLIFYFHILYLYN
ncbi:hypothetical protein KBTX_04217 [wastewater metagenome]|uniref:Uncharacterized protein n=2 Tax=unclassified sequences TaxID=12908 RepID=A0A5B8RJD7_9ZZZZ|nr:hypothetical protein KBTEX_04217 [uncultured organism]